LTSVAELTLLLIYKYKYSYYREMADQRQRIVVTRPSSGRPYDHHDGPLRKKRNSWDGVNDSKDRVRFLERALEDAEKKVRNMGSGPGGDRNHEDLYRKVFELERKNKKLERALDDAESWIKKLQRKSAGENECKDHIEKIIEMTKANKIDKNALQKGERRIKDLEEQINDSAEKVMDAYDTVGYDVDEKNKTLEKALKKAEEKIKQLEKEKDGSKKPGLDSKLELILRRALEDAEKKVVHLESSSMNLKEEFELKLKDAKGEKNILVTNLEDAKHSARKLEEELKDKEGQVALLETELNIAKIKTEEEEGSSVALMNVKKLLADGNVQEKIRFISQEFSSFSNILKNIQDLSN